MAKYSKIIPGVTAPFLRKSSTYLMLVETPDPNKTLDEMVARHKDYVPIETTAVYDGMAGLRFRCSSDDNMALNVALQIAEGRQFVLKTGYGVNQREIAQ